MQDFIRTVDTGNAFKFKVEMLEKELNEKRKEYEYKRSQIDKRNDEIKGLDKVGTFERLKAKTANLIGNIATTIVVILGVVQLLILLNGEKVITEIVFLIIVGTMIAVKFKSSAKKYIQEEYEKVEAAQRKKRILSDEIKILAQEMGEINKLINNQQETIKQQQDVYMNHMLNQQTLLEKEVEMINTANSNNISDLKQQSDMKECPQCAEMVKARAKICRFCNYKFEEAV